MLKQADHMPAAGVIAEYNPFHLGHQYHLKKTRELTGAGICIAVMSGSFVQRGEPAIFDKYVRARMALSNGADVVFEIPAPFSTASARDFAGFGIRMLDALGAVDAVCFGSECGDLGLLEEAAGLFAEESEAFKELLRAGMQAGDSFPKARAAAALQMREEASAGERQAFSALLSSPNNILGIEYLRALREIHSRLRPFTVPRSGEGYHSLRTDGGFASASAIRLLLTGKEAPADGDLRLSRLVPETDGAAMCAERPLSWDDFSPLLDYKIMQILSREGEKGLLRFEDISPELAARIGREEASCQDMPERISSLKTRQLTYTRVSRGLSHILLDITREDMEGYKALGFAPYARLLGFRRESARFLSELKKKSSVPMITKLADAKKILPQQALRLLEQEVSAAHLYQMTRRRVWGCDFKNEYRQPVIII